MFETENPAGATAGLDSVLGLSRFDTQHKATKTGVAQAVSLNLLRQAIADDIESHIAQLDAAVSMMAAGSDAGFLHGLRRAQAVWNAIKSAAGELAAKTDGRGQ
ncbi:MAG TPA: hypothetical protein VIE65_18840 [Methylobacter sp.]